MQNSDKKHIADIDTIKPESVAFVAYIMTSDYGIAFNELVARKVNIPFAKAVIKQAMFFVADAEDGKQRVLEALFVYAGLDEGKASALIVRVFNDGVLDEESVGFYQFLMRPYSLPDVLKAIKTLPQVSLADVDQNIVMH